MIVQNHALASLMGYTRHNRLAPVRATRADVQVNDVIGGHGHRVTSKSPGEGEGFSELRVANPCPQVLEGITCLGEAPIQITLYDGDDSTMQREVGADH